MALVVEPRMSAKIDKHIARSLFAGEQVLGSFMTNRWGGVRVPLVLTTHRLVSWRATRNAVVSIPLGAITAVDARPYLGTAELHVRAANAQEKWVGMARDDVTFIAQLIAGMQAGMEYTTQAPSGQARL